MLLFVIVLLASVQPQMLAQSEFTIPPDGVYSSLSSFKNGKPDLVKGMLIRSLTGSSDFTIRQWANGEKLYYSDGTEEHKIFSHRDIWGFVDGGNFYLHLGNKFHKFSVLGRISYFLESYPMIRGNMAPVVTDARATSSYRLMDMETGELFDYTPGNLQELLAPDEVLYNEFKDIGSEKMKRRRMYSFMERFNRQYPLFK